MAHYAFLNGNNIVTEVITGIDENELIEGKTPEQWYGEFRNQKCVRTSYSTFGNFHRRGGVPFRGNYAGVGFIYDEANDVFYPPAPYPSWILNQETWQWNAPVPTPSNVNVDCLYWDESVLNWGIKEGCLQQWHTLHNQTTTTQSHR